MLLKCDDSISFYEFKSLIRKQGNIMGEFRMAIGFPSRALGNDDSESILNLICNNETVRLIEILPSVSDTFVLNPPLPAKLKTRSETSTASAPTTRKRKAVINFFNNTSSEVDVSESLINAVNNVNVGVHSSRKNAFLRSVYRRAVALQYNSTKAISRLESLHANNFVFMDYNSHNNKASKKRGYILGGMDLKTNEAHISKIMVRYAKGSYATNRSSVSNGNTATTGSSIHSNDVIIHTISSALVDAVNTNHPPQHPLITCPESYYYEEEVDIISKPLILAVLEFTLRSSRSSEGIGITGVEDGDDSEEEVVEESDGGESMESASFLKPINMSCTSPRIFWSLVYHYGTDFVKTYQSLFPNGVGAYMKSSRSDLSSEIINEVDWSWIFERHRELSEKAKENAETEKLIQKQKKSVRNKKNVK